jgi:hypothetical protein
METKIQILNSQGELNSKTVKFSDEWWAEFSKRHADAKVKNQKQYATAMFEKRLGWVLAIADVLYVVSDDYLNSRSLQLDDTLDSIRSVAPQLAEDLETAAGIGEDDSFWARNIDAMLDHLEDWTDALIGKELSDPRLTEEELDDLESDERDEKLVLRFGNEAYDRDGRLDSLDATRRDGPENAVGSLMVRDDRVDEVTKPLMIGDQPFFLHKGLQAVLASSGVGKTTLLANMAQALHSVDRVQETEMVPINFISWNEREYYSNLGGYHDIVRLIENAINSGAKIIMLDSLRELVVGGRGAAGSRGMNTSFFMNLTQWHHAMADRGVSLIVTINPILGQDDFTDVIEEILRGSANGFMHIKKPGIATYEHVGNNRERVDMRFSSDFGQSQLDESAINQYEDSVSFNMVDFDETRFREGVDYILGD